MDLKRKVIRGLGILAAGAVAMQLIPLNRTNPPIESDVPAPENVKAILKASCYDCHSNETVWPWYSHVAPVSWLIFSDTKEGRKHLNFSTWNRYTTEKQLQLVHRSMREVHKGGMPVWFYVMKHPDAKLSPEKIQALDTWASKFQTPPTTL